MCSRTGWRRRASRNPHRASSNRVDDERTLLVQTRGGTLPYRRLLQWINEPAEPAWQARAERARRVNKYHHGWKRYALEEAP